jgi:methyl-accepting chemotaxis protein
VDAIERITKRMQDIDRHAAAVAASVEQQSAATAEISRSVSSAAQGAGDVVAVLDHLAGAATETRRSAESVLGVSEAVGKAVSNLRGEVEGFLAKVAV